MMYRNVNSLQIQLLVYLTLLLRLLNSRPNDPSSTLLRMHKYYCLFPPHETSLYDTLQVLPNATAAQITKQYRKLTRQLHPDKVNHRSTHNQTIDHNKSEEYEHQLFQVRSAYEVLKHDTTRLTYHRYGLLDTGSAAAILTGGKLGHLSHISPLQTRLLEWMGYSNYTGPPTTTRRDDEQYHYHSMRVMLIAIHLVERIRPLVEGVLSQEYLVHEIAKECDALKTLPLGAQILRCIGRAYRLCGQRYLRRYGQSQDMSLRNHKNIPSLHLATHHLTDSLHLKLRHAKSLASAALASGRLLLEESVYSLRQRTRKNGEASILYPAREEMDTFHESNDYKTDDYDMSLTEEEKAHQAVISSLQVEALWKIAKIDLDKTIQEACNVILQGEYFFFPSHLHIFSGDHQGNIPMEGWVASSGNAIDASIGKLRAAAAMVLVGDVMVRSSKDKTSWVD